MHPLIDDSTSLSDAQLEEKIQKLNKAYFVTPNEQVRHQIILMLDTYKIALEERRIAARQAQQENGDNDLDNLINIS